LVDAGSTRLRAFLSSLQQNLGDVVDGSGFSVKNGIFGYKFADTHIP
jgi:hypothetical protein